MTLPKGYDSRKTNYSNEGSGNGIGKTIAGIIFVVIVLAIVGAIYYIGLSQADQETQKNLDRGCIPTSSDWRGIPTTYRCPVP